MNKKMLSIISMVFGGYLLIGNTVLSLILNYTGSIGFGASISPGDYWDSWWVNYGIITIIIASIGIVLVLLGLNIYRSKILAEDSQ